MGGALGGGALGYLVADGLRARRSDAYTAAAGLTLGITNAALLLRPLGRADTSEEVLPILLAGSVVGAGAGLAVGHGLALTRGQVMFAADLGLLGVGTVALTSGLCDQDDEADDSELVLDSRLIGLREQLVELTELRGKNKGVVEYMMGKVRHEK